MIAASYTPFSQSVSVEEKLSSEKRMYSKSLPLPGRGNKGEGLHD